MGRNRSSGLRNRGGIWHIDKQVLGHKHSRKHWNE